MIPTTTLLRIKEVQGSRPQVWGCVPTVWQAKGTPQSPTHLGHTPASDTPRPAAHLPGSTMLGWLRNFLMKEKM
jgi:hypothetical protein